MLELYVMNRHFNNRAVSQIIAALLLIAIAVAAAILLYVFSIGLLGSLGSGGGQQTKEQLILEAYSWGTSGIVATFRNVGPAAINIGGADMFINGIAVTTNPFSATPTLTPQQAATATIAVPGAASCTPGVAYVLKVVTPDGAVFSYSAIDGASS
jgi:flagellin-like protein